MSRVVIRRRSPFLSQGTGLRRTGGVGYGPRRRMLLWFPSRIKRQGRAVIQVFSDDLPRMTQGAERSRGTGLTPMVLMLLEGNPR